MSNNFWENFKQKKWEQTANVELDVITVYCGLDSMANKFSEEVNLPGLLPEDFYIEQKYVDNKFFNRKDQFDLVADLVEQHPHKVLPHFIKRNYDLYESLPDFAEEATKGNLDKMSSQELSDRFSNYIGHYTRALSLVTSPMFLERGIMRLVQGLPATDLLFSNKETATNKERVALLKLASSEKSEKELQNDLQDLVNKYAFTGFRFMEGRARNIEDYYERLVEMRQGNPQSELIRLKKEKSKSKSKKDKLLKELTLTDKQKTAVEFGSEIIFLRTHRLDLINKATWYLDPLLQEICRNLNLSRKDLIYLTPKEINNYLHSPDGLDKNLLESRQKGYAAFLNKKNNIEIVSGSEIEKVRHQDSINTNLKVIEGVSASKGIVKGQVKVLSSIKDKNKLKKGDILITQMTTPDWVTLMEKAGAIITDIGGLTSHAAIVSRELGKPCIVGAKSATQILKDGDKVEVNADKGIVKIIEKR